MMAFFRVFLISFFSTLFAMSVAAQVSKPWGGSGTGGWDGVENLGAKVEVENLSPIRVLSRTDYFDPQIVLEFTQATGIPVEIRVYEGSESEDVQNLLKGASGYDVVLVPANLLSLLAKSEVVFPINTMYKFDQAGNISPQTMRFLIQYDINREKPLRLFGIPFVWGTTAIAYNKKEFLERTGEEAPTGLKNIFDPEIVSQFADCGVQLPDAPGEMIRTALKYKGENPITNKLDIIRGAEETLMAIRPFVSKFHSNDLVSELANGDVCLAMAWSGDILAAHMLANLNDDDVEIGFVNPQEGGPIFLDLFAIPADAKNPENAARLIDFLMKPEIAARISRFSLYPSTNAGANNLNWWADLLDDQTLIPSWDIIDTRFMVPPLDKKSNNVTLEIWQRVMAAPGHSLENE